MSQKRSIGGVIGSLVAGLASGTIRMINGRRSWLIHPKFQGKVILFGLSIGGFALSLTYAALRFFFWRCDIVLVESGLPSDHAIFEFLTEQQRLMSAIFMVVLCFTTVFAAVVGIFLSHRVAGPLYRLRKHLLAVAEGAPPARVKFRDNDYFQEIAEAYNASLEKSGMIARPAPADIASGDTPKES